MTTATVNGVKLYFEAAGPGEIPLVLVHGSWGSHETWKQVVPELAGRFHVVTYDRRGHGQSERPKGQGSILEDVADLAALIEHLELSRTWIVGNSFGGCIALRLAVARPEIVSGVIVHEPPMYGVLADDPSMAEALQDLKKRHGEVVKKIAAGDHQGASKLFIRHIPFGRSPVRLRPPEWSFQASSASNGGGMVGTGGEERLSGPRRPISAPFLRCSGAPVRSQVMRPPVLDRPPVIQTPW